MTNPAAIAASLRPAFLPLALGFALLPASALAEPVERVAAPVAGASEGLAAIGPLYITANAAVVSEYRFRGVRLSGGDPAVQAGVDASLLAGFYAGAFASTLDTDTLGYGAVELDLYAGWSGPVAEGLAADVGVIAYLYPDAGAGAATDWTELYGSLTYTLGPASVRVGAAWDVGQDGIAFAGPQGSGLIRDNLYVYTDLSVGVPGTGVTLTGLAGHTTGWRSGAEGPEWNWSLGAEMPLAGPLRVGVAYVDAGGGAAGPGAGGFDPLGGSVVGALRASF